MLLSLLFVESALILLFCQIFDPEVLNLQRLRPGRIPIPSSWDLTRS